MSLINFEAVLDQMVDELHPEYRNWDGDVMELNDTHKDSICYHFLLNMKTWWDDILPPVLINPEDFLHELYTNSASQSISAVIRDDIYLSLELTLRDLVQDSYDRVNQTKPEPFAGYDRGQ